MVRTPTARGLTVEDARNRRLTKTTLWIIVFVSILAAVVSFQALLWVGSQLGAAWAAPIVPIAVDGISLVFALSIVDSETKGKPFAKRITLWTGLLLMLGLSVAGNIYHAIHVGTGLLPLWLTYAYAAAPPVIVFFGVHVLGKALSGGVDAHVLASDPDTVRFDITRVSEYDRAHATQPGAPRAARTKTAQPAREVTAQPASQTREEKPAKAARTDPAREALFEEYRAGVARGERMDSNRIAEALEIHPGNARTLRGKWDKRIAAELAIADPVRDEILEQLTDQQQLVARSA